MWGKVRFKNFPGNFSNKKKKSGILFGVKDFGKGVAEGIGGVLYQPLKGAKEEGGVGLVKGIGKGLVG
jgi:sterol 3beta-glucosyltransferase